MVGIDRIRAKVLAATVAGRSSEIIVSSGTTYVRAADANEDARLSVCRRSELKTFSGTVLVMPIATLKHLA